MAHDKTNKNRKYGRNKKWCEAYRKRGQRERNRRARWLRCLRAGKYMNRVLALRLHAEYRIGFQHSPHANERGPYVPENKKLPGRWAKRLLP